MESVYKNIICLGAAMLFAIFFWVYSEIQKSQALIEVATDRELSTLRGFLDAESDLESGYPEFQSWKGDVPHLTEEELAGKYQMFSPYQGFICGTGFLHDYNPVRLYIERYQYNEYYVNAYNIRLKELINAKF